MQPHPRRLFIKRALSSSAFLALYQPIQSVFGQSLSKSIFPSWVELVEYARWCPSVHNLQAHKLKIISESEADLYYDPARLLPVGDPQAIFVTVAMGIFIEHLSIAASIYGYNVKILEVFQPISTQNKTLTRFAKVQLEKSFEYEELNRELIKKRRTSRIQYNGIKLNQSLLEKLKIQTEKAQHEFFYSEDQEFVNLIIELNQKTLFEDLESEANRKELNQLFRYSKKEAEISQDGLWSQCMGFPGSLMKSVFIHHKKWTKGLRKKLILHTYKESFDGTTTLCWIGGKFDNTQDWLVAGRMLARNWLIVTQEDAYIHPFGSLITNPAAYQKICEKFQNPSMDKKIWMVFRAGYSAEPARSYRLSTNQIIIG